MSVVIREYEQNHTEGLRSDVVARMLRSGNGKMKILDSRGSKDWLLDDRLVTVRYSGLNVHEVVHNVEDYIVRNFPNPVHWTFNYNRKDYRKARGLFFEVFGKPLPRFTMFEKSKRHSMFALQTDIDSFQQRFSKI